jgi:preprotein translocase subunit SecA
MGFNDFLGKIFGSKGLRDLKEITPFVESIKAVYDEIKALSNDELRNRTELLKLEFKNT